MDPHVSPNSKILNNIMDYKLLSRKRKNVSMNMSRNKRATLNEMHVLTPPISPTLLIRDATPRSSIGFLIEKNVGVENLSIGRFQGLNPVMSMIDKGLTLTFPVPKNPGIFVVTGVLSEHDMDIFKEVYSCFRVFSY
jgi:hypothetical protein